MKKIICNPINVIIVGAICGLLYFNALWGIFIGAIIGWAFMIIGMMWFWFYTR